MKAAVLTRLNSPLQILEVEPGHLQYGQVLVRILASGICGSQLQEIAGHKGNGDHLPHLLGHEGCGIVEQCGLGVTTINQGDKVVLHWRKAAGIESEPPCYNLDGKQITSGRVTTFSEYSICSENRLTTVPHGTPDELCALMGCGLSTALGTIERDAQLRMGESVLIVGVGGLGCNLIRAAYMVHATPIVAIDINSAKRGLVERMGACWASSWQEVARIGFDCAIDTTGDPRAIATAMSLLNPSGRFVMVGQPKPDATVCMLNARHFFEGEGKTIKATQGGGFLPHFDIPRYVKTFAAGMLNISDIVTHRFELDDINCAIELVREGNAGRIIIRP